MYIMYVNEYTRTYYIHIKYVHVYLFIHTYIYIYIYTYIYTQNVILPLFHHLHLLPEVFFQTGTRQWLRETRFFSKLHLKRWKIEYFVEFTYMQIQTLCKTYSTQFSSLKESCNKCSTCYTFWDYAFCIQNICLDFRIRSDYFPE